MNAPILSESFAEFYAWYSPTVKHPHKLKRLFENHVEPVLGDKVSRDITRGQIFKLLTEIQTKVGDNVARAVLGMLKQVFDYMVNHEIRSEDPVQAIKPKSLRLGPVVKRDRVCKLEEVREIVSFTNMANVQPSMKAAIKLQAILVNRVGELCLARWEHIDFKEQNWFVPKENSKNGKEYTRPLPTQAIKILEALKPYTLETGMVLGDLMPCNVTGTLKRWQDSGRLKLDAPTTIHDLRRTATTRLAEDFAVQPHVIKALLSHVDVTATAHYNHAEYLDERREVTQKWADAVFG